MNLKGTKKKNQVVTTNIFEKQELLKKAEVIRKNLTASTWHELETNGKFDKNAKLSFISDDMLILMISAVKLPRLCGMIRILSGKVSRGRKERI